MIRWRTGRDGRRLHGNREFGVAIRRLHAHVNDPGPDLIPLDSRLQQMDGRGVPREVRGDRFRTSVATALGQYLGVAAHEPVDVKARRIQSEGCQRSVYRGHLLGEEQFIGRQGERQKTL